MPRCTKEKEKLNIYGLGHTQLLLYFSLLTGLISSTPLYGEICH